MKQGILFWVWQKASGNWATWSDFANGGKANVEQILASEKINKSKRAGQDFWKFSKNLASKNVFSAASDK